MNNLKISKFSIAFRVVGVAFAVAALFVVGLHAVHAAPSCSPHSSLSSKSRHGRPKAIRKAPARYRIRESTCSWTGTT